VPTTCRCLGKTIRQIHLQGLGRDNVPITCRGFRNRKYACTFIIYNYDANDQGNVQTTGTPIYRLPEISTQDNLQTLWIIRYMNNSHKQ
jgi:hypothetical protein